MPIETAEIQYRLSGGASNADPALSIGGVMSSELMGDDLFADVDPAEAVAGSAKYRLIYITNVDPALTLTGAGIWIQTNTPSVDSALAIGLAAAGYNATESAVANENTAPAGVTFSSPSDEGSALDLTDIAPGARFGVWVRRTIDAAADAYTGDGGTLRVKGGTLA